jgi:hypothetical protein
MRIKRYWVNVTVELKLSTSSFINRVGLMAIYVVQLSPKEENSYRGQH